MGPFRLASAALRPESSLRLPSGSRAQSPWRIERHRLTDCSRIGRERRPMSRGIRERAIVSLDQARLAGLQVADGMARERRAAAPDSVSRRSRA